MAQTPNHVLVQRKYREIVDLDLLEDRREYAVDDFMHSLDMNRTDATLLYQLVQAQFKPITTCTGD